MSDNYADETKPLFKLLKTEAFRFVIVRYNHYSFVSQLEEDIKRLFPDRPIEKMDAQTTTYQDISSTYFAHKRGFFFIEHFDILLKEERDSLNKETPPMKIENERRRHITAGLNLRRDKLAQFPIALFIFIPSTSGEFYAKTIMEKMPDLWSFRSFMLDLEKEISIINNNNIGSQINIKNTYKNINIYANEKQETKLKRLLELLSMTPKNEIAYRHTLYPQIVDIAKEIGSYDLALVILQEWELSEKSNKKADIWIQKGHVLEDIGKLNEAIRYFEKAQSLFQEIGNKYMIATCLHNIGSIHETMGNLDTALLFHEKYFKLSKEFYTSSPNNLTFKFNLGISYQHLGSTYEELGHMDKALEFNENFNHVAKELYTTSPNNIDFKTNLAVAYQSLGNIHLKLKNLDISYTFYEKFNNLVKELYDANTDNIHIKHGVTISYQKLGDIQTSKGNLDNALVFYDEGHRLNKEINTAYPNNINIKSNLAVSYAKLGAIYLNSNKLEIADNYFKSYKKLCGELVKDSPLKVHFQSNYAESISVSAAATKLLYKITDSKELLKSKDIFNKLYNQTKNPYYLEKAEIVDKMLLPDSDLKQLILDISMF